jgi:hypothetical protein
LHILYNICKIYVKGILRKQAGYNLVMSDSKVSRITKEDVLVIIDNYKRNGRDTTELETFLREAFSGTSKDETPSIDQMVADLRKKSPMTEGKCSICGAAGTLLSGVCETCFLPWATKVAGNSIARVKKSKQREKF